MRVSMREDSPYFTHAALDAESVMFNGERRLDCVEASEEDGFVDVLVRDASGSFMHDGNEVRTERLYGDVKIIMRGDR